MLGDGSCHLPCLDDNTGACAAYKPGSDECPAGTSACSDAAECIPCPGLAPDANGDRTSDESMTRTVVVDDRIHGVTDSAVWTFDAELRDPEVRTPL
jgi:hypothetical protein